MATPFIIRAAEWHRDCDSLRAVRQTVFIDEQQVPEALEWDGADLTCTHVLAVSTHGAPIGTGRLLPDGHIGRMAVLRDWRGRGVGGAMLVYLLECARAEGFRQVRLHAQLHAMPFYAKYGFTAIGRRFVEAGIPHRLMVATFVPRDRAQSGRR